jgi:hypothetical protein
MFPTRPSSLYKRRYHLLNLDSEPRKDILAARERRSYSVTVDLELPYRFEPLRTVGYSTPLELTKGRELLSLLGAARALEAYSTRLYPPGCA